MELKELQRNWQALGSEDPFYGVLSDPSRRGHQWNREEFFQTGIDEVVELMETVSIDAPDLEKNRCLDFGCAVGRLTQPLADYFEQAVGVDIAPAMIQKAEALNSKGARCQFVLNERSDLSRFDSSSFDFIYSNIVLQHMEPRYSRVYIAEFIRLLRPGGLAVFQIPAFSEDKAWRKRLKRWLPRSLLLAYRQLRYGKNTVADVEVEMHGLPQFEVKALIEGAGAKLEKVKNNFYWVNKS